MILYEYMMIAVLFFGSSSLPRMQIHAYCTLLEEHIQQHPEDNEEDSQRRS